MKKAAITMRWKTLMSQFKTEMTDRATLVDTSNELDWYSLTVGWAVAKGLSPDEARSFSTHVRYETDLG